MRAVARQRFVQRCRGGSRSCSAISASPAGFAGRVASSRFEHPASAAPEPRRFAPRAARTFTAFRFSLIALGKFFHSGKTIPPAQSGHLRSCLAPSLRTVWPRTSLTRHFPPAPFAAASASAGGLLSLIPTVANCRDSHQSCAPVKTGRPRDFVRPAE